MYKRQLKHLAVALLLVVGIGFSVGFCSNAFGQIECTVIAFFPIILTASFFMYEVAHKVNAQKRGSWAEFRLTLWGAILTLISVISRARLCGRHLNVRCSLFGLYVVFVCSFLISRINT